MTKDIYKKEAWIFGAGCIILLLLVCTLGLTARYFYNNWLDNKRIEFMTQYIPIKASRAVLKWCKEYKLYKKGKWLDVFSLLMTESNGDVLAKSHANCKGLMQLAKRTAQILKNRLKDKIKSCGVYDIEFNVAGGILYLRNLYDHYCSQDLWLSIEVYNVGDYNYFTRKKRASFHMRRFGINKTYFEFEWQKFKAIF